MASAPRDRIEPWVLIMVAIGLIVFALLSYDGHPVKNSNLYAPDIPGWILVATFVLTGILVRLVYIYDRRRAAKDKRNATPKI